VNLLLAWISALLGGIQVAAAVPPMAPELVPVSWFEILIASLVPALGVAIMFYLLSRFLPRLAVRVFITVGLLFMLFSYMGPLALPVINQK
jgi:hypothetical protein